MSQKTLESNKEENTEVNLMRYMDWCLILLVLLKVTTIVLPESNASLIVRLDTPLFSHLIILLVQFVLFCSNPIPFCFLTLVLISFRAICFGFGEKNKRKIMIPILIVAMYFIIILISSQLLTR